MKFEQQGFVASGDLSIQTGRLRLRKLNNGDAEALFAYRSQPEIYAYQARTATVADAAAFIAGTADRLDDPGTWYQLGIFRIEDPTLIGDIGIHFINLDEGEVELGFTLAPLFQRQGYAAEAVSAVISYLFSQLKKRRIVINVDPKNVRSRRLAGRLGLVRMGGHDERIPDRSDACTDITYMLNAEDWLGR